MCNNSFGSIYIRLILNRKWHVQTACNSWIIIEKHQLNRFQIGSLKVHIGLEFIQGGWINILEAYSYIGRRYGYSIVNTLNILLFYCCIHSHKIRLVLFKKKTSWNTLLLNVVNNLGPWRYRARKKKLNKNPIQ